MNLNEEITLAIQKNLPAAVAGELKSYLEEAEKNKILIIELQENNKELRDSYNTTYNNCHNLEIKLNQHKTLDIREAEILKQENNLKVTIAQIELTHALKRADIIQELVSTIFKNPTMRRSLTKSDSMNNKYDSRSGQYIDTKTGEYITEETTEE